MRNLFCYGITICFVLIACGTSAQTPFEYQLDSIRNPESGDVLRFFYNSEGKCTQSELATPNSQNLYELEQQVYYSYTASGLIEEVSVWYWNDELNMFVESRKNTYTYDNEDRQVESLSIVFDDSDSVWYPLQKYEWEYSVNGDLVFYRRLSSALSWGELTENWRYTYTYSDDGLDYVELLEVYVGGLGLINSRRTTHSTLSEFQKEILLETWEEDEWQLATLTEVLYEDGRVVEELVFEYDDEEVWQEHRLNQYTYTEWDEHESTSGYSLVDDEWFLIYLEQKIFDDDENLLSNTQYDWDEGMSQLQPTYSTNYSLGDDLLSNTALPPFSLNREIHTHQVLSKASLTYFNGIVFSNIWSLYHYSEFSPTAITKSEVLEANVYPNPTTDFIRITTDAQYGSLHVMIRSLSGKLVYDNWHSSHAEISTTSFPAGMYIYQASAGDRIARGKIIIN